MGGLRLTLVFIFLGSPAFGQQDSSMGLTWTDNLLRIHADYLPGGSIEILYLEAFCRPKAHDRDWRETVIPHTTRLLSRSEQGTRLELESRIAPGAIAHHTIESGTDEVSFHIRFTNPTQSEIDLQWAQPCMRVGRFTGLSQEDYWRRCFIFTPQGRTFLDEMERSQEARYRGGQVFVPKGVDPEDVNPRPISPVTPNLPLIGCVSGDEKWILATAWDRTHELFQGVITCIHSDFQVGGLKAGEIKEVRGKVYLLENDAELLRNRWRFDFWIP